MSPLQIEILLHYNSRVDDYRNGDHNAPAVREAFDWFVRELLLEPVATMTLCKAGLKPEPGRVYFAEKLPTPKYRVTERGRAYVESLCMTPLPQRREVWVTPERVERIHHQGGT